MTSIPLGKLLTLAPSARLGPNRSLPILSMTMRDGLVDQADKFKKRIASADLAPYKVVAAGQLVVGFPIDEAVLAFQSRYPEVVVSPAYGVWDVNESLADRGYLERFLRSPQAIVFYKARLRGSTARRRSLPNATFLSLPVPLPPLPEQRRIASILDQADALRGERRAVANALELAAESVYYQLFGSSKFEEHGIETLCHAIVDCVNRTAPLAAAPTPFKMIRTSNVRNHSVDTDSVRYVDEQTFTRWTARLLPKAGDVLLTREAPSGEAAVLRTEDQVFLGQRIMHYRPNTQYLDPEYLARTLMAPTMRRRFDASASGSTVKHLSVPFCRTFSIPLPPIELQVEFANRMSALRCLDQRSEVALAKLDELFASLQHRAFRGEL